MNPNKGAAIAQADHSRQLPTPHAVSEVEDQQPMVAVSKRYGFTIENTHLLAPEGEYCELIPNFQVSLLPNAPKHMLGIINLRGNLVPLYKTSSTQLPKGTSAYALLIGDPKKGAAVLIYGKPKAISIQEDTPTAEAEFSSSWLEGCIDASYYIDGETWNSVNTEKFFKKLANKG
ncbi:MAG: hypothetical protein K6L80_12665 [Agarilytica sp.]